MTLRREELEDEERRDELRREEELLLLELYRLDDDERLTFGVRHSTYISRKCWPIG